MFMAIFLFLLLCFIVVAARGGRRTVSTCVRRHRRYRKTAQRVLGRLPQLSSDGARLSYLRKINPYVFEELLLLALEKQGLEVIRNRSYSGDGGLDGQVFINGERWLIQAKRYSRSISPQHIQAFGKLLAREGCGGFFIHTGRTGHMSRTLCSASPRLLIISGQRLLDLLSGGLTGCETRQTVCRKR